MLFSDVDFTWKDVLIELNKSFKEHPILEMAVASTYIDITRRKTQSDNRFPSESEGLWKMKSALYPYYHFGRCLAKMLRPNPILRRKKEPITNCGVFVIGSSRENDFGCIYPVLRMHDEASLGSVLFLDSSIMNDRYKEINQLNHCEIVFYDLMQYTLPPKSFRVIRFDENQIEEMLFRCYDARISNFLLENIDKIRFEMKKILIKTYFIYNHLNNKGYRFLFSIGHFPFSLAAKRLGLRTYVISHGFIVSNERTIFFSPHNMDEVISWGPMSNNIIREICGENVEIVPLGNPRYDKLFKDYQNAERDSPSSGFKITYFSHSHVPDAEEKYIAAAKGIMRIRDEFPDIEINIKLHPYENDEIYRNYFDHRFSEFSIINDHIGTSLPSIYKNTDLALSIDSTTLLEAMLFGIPGIQLGLSEHGVLSDYYKYGATILVKDEDTLIEKIREYHQKRTTGINLAREAFLENNIVNIGSATERILAHMVTGG